MITPLQIERMHNILIRWLQAQLQQEDNFQTLINELLKEAKHEELMQYQKWYREALNNSIANESRCSKLLQEMKSRGQNKASCS